jgi:hypothetical protein
VKNRRYAYFLVFLMVTGFILLFKTPYLHTLPQTIANILAKLHLIFLLFVPDVRYSFGMYPFLQAIKNHICSILWARKQVD